MNTQLFRSLCFTTSAARLDQCPSDSVAEVAFAGRSNAGKSSALNRLAEQRKLAKTSRTPGRTQLLNYFELAPSRYLVDLPGYGYARVAEAVKLAWQRELSHYLHQRTSLVGLVLLMDIRHPLKPLDQSMLAFCADRDLKVQLLLTKADKLSRSQAQRAVTVSKKVCQQDGWNNVNVDSFSARQGEGVDVLRCRLLEWLGLTKTLRGVENE